LEQRLAQSPLNLVYFGDKQTSPTYEKFILAAKTEQEYDYFQTHQKCSEAFLGQNKESLAIYRRFDESPVIWENKGKDKIQGKEVL